MTVIALPKYTSALQELMDTLNEHQLQAVGIGQGQASLIGVPGSGKTRTIVARIARLVADGLDPDYILAMTFTRAAAQEMNERLAQLGIEGARVGTIHSVCRQIVASDTDLFDHLQLDEGSKLFWELKKMLAELRRHRKIPNRGVDFEGVLRFIESCKARGPCYVFGDPWGLNVKAEGFVMQEAKKWSMAAGLTPTKLAEVFNLMEQRRANIGRFGFDDMLLWSWMQLFADEMSRQRWRQRWSVVIIDEAQDSNPVQWDVARFLVGLGPCLPDVATMQGAPREDHDPHNLMVGGDPSQSIYGWRSAEPQIYVDFTESSEVTKVVLPINYRSNAQVCAVGTGLVKDKKWHVAGTITPFDDKEVKDKVVVRRYDNPEMEARDIVTRCLEIAQNKGESLRSCAVLARLRVGLDLAEIECIRRRIKYVKMASGSFIESREVKDVLAYLRVASGLDPTGKWLRHIINRPFRYIGKQFITQCEEYGQANNLSIIDAMMELKMQLVFKQRRALDELYKLLREMNKVALQCEERAAHAEKLARDNAILVDGKLSFDAINRLAEVEESRQRVLNAGVDESEGAEGAQLTRAEAGDDVVQAGTLCSVCDKPQFNTGTGITCENGHKDAPAKEEPEDPPQGPADLVTMVVERTNYIEEIRREEGLLGLDESKIAMLGELHRMGSMFATVSEFLVYADALAVAIKRARKQGLKVKEDSREDALVLSTIHRAKGLEWRHVFLADVVQGRFPCSKAEDMDEELRLLYVAITRAIDTCSISHTAPPPDPKGGRGQQRQSSFITLVERELGG